MEIIQFQNREFKAKEVEFPEIGTVLVSTNSLNELLLDKNGRYVSNEAISVDESIFYFVEESEIELSSNELMNLITSNIR